MGLGNKLCTLKMYMHSDNASSISLCKETIHDKLLQNLTKWYPTLSINYYSQYSDSVREPINQSGRCLFKLIYKIAFTFRRGVGGGGGICA